jgi:hypothetical protein
MDQMLYDMLNAGGSPAAMAMLAGLMKYILTISFLVTGIRYFTR